MLLTLLLALIFIAAVFGALYAIVGLIQNRRLMTTAPKDIQAAAKDHPYHRIPVRRYGACGDLYAVLNGGENNESLYAGGARRDGTAVKYGVFKNSRKTILNTNLKRRV